MNKQLAIIKICTATAEIIHNEYKLKFLYYIGIKLIKSKLFNVACIYILYILIVKSYGIEHRYTTQVDV